MEEGTPAGEEEEVGRTAALRRQSTTAAVRRRIGLNYATEASGGRDMNQTPNCSVNSRDVYNLSIRAITLWDDGLSESEWNRNEKTMNEDWIGYGFGSGNPRGRVCGGRMDCRPPKAMHHGRRGAMDCTKF
jgi:hypothetical protein